MKIDSELLEKAISAKTTEPVFRLYGWSPRCVSLGRNQKQEFLLETDIKIESVRRVTGGRALLHDDEITYCYISPIDIIPNGENIIDSYKYISGMLIEFFSTLGINLDYGVNKKVSSKFDYCMLLSTGADVCFNNKKLIGSAQFRKNGYILQHGSILYGYDKELLEKLFHETVHDITCIKEIMPTLTKEEIITNLFCFMKNRVPSINYDSK